MPTPSTATPPATPGPAEPLRDLARAPGGERRADDHRRRARRGRRGHVGSPLEERERLQRDERGAAEHDDAREEAVGVEADEPRAQAREEPEVGERGAGEERGGGVGVVAARAASAGKASATYAYPSSREPRPRHAAKLQHRGMRPTLVQYEAPGWGVGEVWLDDDGVVFYSRAAPSEADTRPVSDTGRCPRGTAGRVLRGEPDDFADVALGSTTGSTATAPARCGGSARRGRHLRRARGARRATPGAARAAGTFCARCDLAPFLPVHRVVAAGGIGSWGGLGVEYKRRLLALEGVCSRLSLSEDLRDELAQIAPSRRCCRLAELSALFHASGAWHLRGGGVAVHLDLSSSAAARRAFALLRDLGVRSEIRTYAGASFDRATRYQLHVEVDDRALERAPRGGRALGRRARRSSIRRSASSAARAAAAPTCAARCSAPARSRARATRTSSCAASGLDGARFIAEVAAREGVTLAVAERRGARGRLREGARADRRPARARRRGRHGAAARGARGRRRDARATRTGSRTRTRRTSSAPRAPRTRSSRRSASLDLDALPPHLAEIAELRLRHPSASLRELAAKARPPLSKAAAHRRLQAVVKLVETDVTDLQLL